MIYLLTHRIIIKDIIVLWIMNIILQLGKMDILVRGEKNIRDILKLEFTFMIILLLMKIILIGFQIHSLMEVNVIHYILGLRLRDILFIKDILD